MIAPIRNRGPAPPRHGKRLGTAMRRACPPSGFPPGRDEGQMRQDGRWGQRMPTDWRATRFHAESFKRKTSLETGGPRTLFDTAARPSADTQLKQFAAVITFVTTA